MVCVLTVIIHWIVWSYVGCSNVDALSSSSSSPWSPAMWRLTLNLGRESSSSSVVEQMPDSWGASGARLAFAMNVMVQPDRDETEPEWRCLDMIDDGGSTFVNEQGQQRIRISRGGWKLELPTNNNNNKGVGSQLQIWLDVESDIERRDVRISKGSRLYLSANCWREAEYDYGCDVIMTPIYQAMEESQRRLDDTLSHDTGDRRLDGTDPVDTVLAYKDMAQLVHNRDESRRKWQDMLSRRYPSPHYEATHDFGHWPASKELLLIHPTSLNIKLQTKHQFLPLINTEQYPIIGHWKADPIFHDDDDDDEQEY